MGELYFSVPKDRSLHKQSFLGTSEMSFDQTVQCGHSGRAGVRAVRVTYLLEAGVDGADEYAEGLARAAAHGAEHLAQEGDEAEPALHILLLKLLPHREVLLWRHKRPCQPRWDWGGVRAPPLLQGLRAGPGQLINPMFPQGWG